MLPCVYDNVNIFSKTVFFWVWRFIFDNYKSTVSVDSLYKCSRFDQSEKLCNRLQRNWEKELQKTKTGGNPSLFWAVLKMIWGYYFLTGLLMICMQGVQVLQTLFMGWMVRNLTYLQTAEDTSELKKEIYFYAAGICISQMVYVLGMNPYFFNTVKIGMQIRIACCSLIYRKALRLSKSAFAKTTVGQIVNLMSNDVNRFDICPIYPFFIIVGPLQIAAVIYILWPSLNNATLFGIAILLLYIPLQAIMGKSFSKLRAKAAVLTDERVRLMNEFVPAMRIIKMYTWEKPFAILVDEARKKEIQKIRNSAILRAINLGLFNVSAKLILFVIFILYVFRGGHLTAETVFVTMSLINQVRLSVTLFLPYTISTGAEALISLKRIRTFLLLPEQEDQQSIQKSSFITRTSEMEVTFNILSASWTQSTNPEDQTLKNISFTVKGGQLLAIVGSVGSGKTSVLMSVLGELKITEGNSVIKGRVSYASQEPWTFAGTVRENIIYGSQFDQSKYNKVIHVCALERDLSLFPLGDRTMVGERGVSLSGGQRARINLARCIYHDADIYLLDDPLSAVDASVAKHIFEKSVQDYLRKKIVILVTHQLQFIKAAHHILILKGGCVLSQGTYTELLNQGIDFVKFRGGEKSSEDLKADMSRPKIVRQASISSEAHGPDPFGSTLSLSSSIHVEEENATQTSKQVTFMESETKDVSEAMVTAASARAYWVYVTSGTGWFLLPLIIVLVIAAQMLFTGSDWWLSMWTDAEERRHLNTSQNVHTFIDDCTQEENIWIYTAQIFSLFILSLMRAISFFVMCMRASVKLHDRLFQSVVRAPISFFDNNPIGIILNRCSRDMGIIDDLLPPTAFDALGILSNDFGITILIAYIDYWVLLPTVVLVVIFWYVRRLYVKIAKDIKRLEGITRSPVFSHLSTSLYGLSSIRAFNSQNRFEKKFDTYQDCHTSAWFLYLSSSRWFIVVLDWICVAYITSITVAMVINMDTINGSSVALAITSALMFSGGFQWGIRQLTEMETQMTSVERVDEYSNLPSEGELESPPDRKPSSQWPEKGEIIFDNVWLQYDEHPVLKNLCFTINAKEKIGIVGRTGAGKSSMIAALFRLTESSGSVFIDGIDTKSIGLHDLRRKIAIIPQEPILFSGTIRRNLDPFNEHTDDKLWDVLSQVQLECAVSDLPEGLEAWITDGGSNFSVGQRQLICLARAILRKNQILVLDEATANVDPRTDSLIQETIREVFSTCTIITIAHRLHTIMDSDKVLVLDAGRVEQFDEPLNLLKDKDGLFYSMVKSTGKEMSENLMKMAQLAYDLRHNESHFVKQQLLNTRKEVVSEKSDNFLMDAVIETEDEINLEVTKF